MKKYTMDDFFAGRILVKAASKKEMMELLKACEKRGIKWMSGDKPTKWIPPILAVEIFMGKLFYSSKPVNPVWYKDLIESHRCQIIIDCDGDITTARMIINGKEVKAARAKRNPDDPFNWKLAAYLAFNRLFGDKPTFREVKRPAKVGEYIKLIRKEFSFNKKGDILHVSRIAPSGNPVVEESGHPRKPNSNAEGWCYSKGCFVVLEGYKPSK